MSRWWTHSLTALHIKVTSVFFVTFRESSTPTASTASQACRARALRNSPSITRHCLTAVQSILAMLLAWRLVFVSQPQPVLQIGLLAEVTGPKQYRPQSDSILHCWRWLLGIWHCQTTLGFNFLLLFLQVGGKALSQHSPCQLPRQGLSWELAHTGYTLPSIVTEAWFPDRWSQQPKSLCTCFLKHLLMLIESILH